MNLDQKSSSASDERKTPKGFSKHLKQMLGVFCILIAVGVFIVAMTSKTKKVTPQATIPAASPTITIRPTEQLEQLSEEERKTLEAYQHYCATYNGVVDAYNKGVYKYNNLLEQLSKFDFLSFPKPYPEANKLETNRVPAGWSQAQFEKKKTEMEQIAVNVDDYYIRLIVNTYNCVIDEYNLIAKVYNDATKVSSVEFIEGVPAEVQLKNHITELNEDMLRGSYFASMAIEQEVRENEELASFLVLVQQLTNPSEQWVVNRLKTIDGIVECQPVTEGKDPNQLLGKAGGYTSCIYFSYSEINQDTVKGNDVVDKGTDGGGAIEVYSNKGDALNRCEYLAQFDDTLLYTGSYTIIGSMVIRTSYKLTNQQQIDLTNKIVKAITILSE